jgi:hypothetical protein
MNTRSRTYKTIFRASVVASATTLAALSLASPASAIGFDSVVGVGSCTGGPPPQKCGNPLHLPFTTTTDVVQVTFTKNPNPCPDFNLFADIDGNPITVGPEIPLAAGDHTINLDASGAGCPQFTSWGGHLTVAQIKHTGQAPAAPAALPLQGPTADFNPILGGVAATITDHSGVASKCTYSSGIVNRSFSLPANGNATVDIVPLAPLGITYDVHVKCDNGTSLDTSTTF